MVAAERTANSCRLPTSNTVRRSDGVTSIVRHWLLAILLLTGFARGGEQASEPSGRESGWSTFGEGFSSLADGVTIEISSRAHTAPSLTEWHDRGTVVGQLDVTPRAIRVRVGEPLGLGRLKVIARDSTGHVIERVPLSFAIEGPPGLVDFDGFRSYGGGILATGPGVARIWVASLLPTATGEYLREPVALIVE